MQICTHAIIYLDIFLSLSSLSIYIIYIVVIQVYRLTEIYPKK